MEIVIQMKSAAEMIQQNNQKIIPVFPLKKSERAFTNVSRRMLLGFLMGNTDAQEEYPEVPVRALREMLEKQAAGAGYILQEVNPDDY